MLLRLYALLSTSVFLAQTPASVLPDTPQFQRADPGATPGQVRFDAFQPLNWEALALEHLKSIDLNRPTARQIADLKTYLLAHPIDESGRSAEVSFPAPLQPSLQHGFYYALSLESVLPLRLKALEGYMRYHMEKNDSEVGTEVFYGQLLATKDSTDASDPAFVMFTPERLPISKLPAAAFSTFRKGRDIVYRHVRDGKTSEVALPGDEGLFDLQAVSFFKIGVLEYILAQWKPDTDTHFMGCQRQYSLFVVDGGLKLITTNQSGCDV